MRRIEIVWLIIVSVVGAAIFALPFVTSLAMSEVRPGSARTLDASILMAVILGATLFVAIGELTHGPKASSASRTVALLGALVALDATLRLIPSFLGASPIFALIVLVGAVFGSQFGFVMGALTLLASAAITAGVGPWLPFQMLCAGWVGLGAGWLPHGRTFRARVAWIAAYGALAGIAFGALMNLYSWPFAAPGLESDAGLYWHPGLSLAETMRRYWSFYLVTSLTHDLTRAAANVALVLLAGAPTLRLLDRYKARSQWSSGATENDLRCRRPSAIAGSGPGIATR